MKNILVVDDSASIRQMLNFTLTRAGYSVTEVSDGNAGFEAASKQFDLVITDINMPGIDGYELVTKLRSKSNYKFTPILMLTTQQSADRKAQGKAVGATGWLVKPFDPERLVKIVQKVWA